MSSWQITGQYMETCNCTFLCPCISSNLAARPTEGDCKPWKVYSDVCVFAMPSRVPHLQAAHRHMAPVELQVTLLDCPRKNAHRAEELMTWQRTTIDAAANA